MIPSAIVSTFALLGAILVAALVVFLALEALFRLIRAIEETFFFQPVRRQDFMADEYQDYVNWVEDWSKPMFQYLPIGFRHFNTDNSIPGRVRNNSLGFRCEEFTDPDPEALRIAIVGGSAAWGSGAKSNDTTIAGRLEVLLNNDRNLLGARKRARCFNLAQVNGYQTQDLLTLLFIAPRIRPDIVISFTGWNEMMANDTMKRRHLEKYRAFYMNEMEGWEPLNVTGNKGKLMKDSFRIWAIDKSEFLRRFMPQPAPGHENSESVEDRLELGRQLFLEHLAALQCLSRGYGFKHFQFMQPYLYRKKNLTEQEQRVIKLYDEVRPVHGGRKTGDYLRQNNIYLPLIDLIRETRSDIGPVFDLCDIFREETDSRFFTLVHLTDSGYDEIARQMHRVLAANCGGKVEAVAVKETT